MENLKSEMELLIECSRHLHIIISDFQPENSQAALNLKLSQIVTALSNIEKLRTSVSNIQVPLEVFEYIDKDKNPQFYTKDYMEKALSKNEEIKGKVEYYNKFSKILSDELAKVFPNEMNNYNKLRPKKPNQSSK